MLISQFSSGLAGLLFQTGDNPSTTKIMTDAIWFLDQLGILNALKAGVLVVVAIAMVRRFFGGSD